MYGECFVGYVGQKTIWGLFYMYLMCSRNLILKH